MSALRSMGRCRGRGTTLGPLGPLGPLRPLGPPLTVLLLLLTLSPHIGAALKAADLFKVCKRNDPNLNECVKTSIDQLRPTLVKGIPALKVASMDPMVISQIGLIQGNGPVSIESSFKDLHIKGFTRFRLDDVKVDLEKYRIELKVFLDWFYTWGDYDIKGRILVLPISGNGPSWSNYTNVRGAAVIAGHPLEKKGKTYFNVDDLKLDMDVGHATIHMDNLFNGNTALGDAMNKFMSDNWKVVFSELKPVIEEAVSTLLRDVVHKIFDRFPIDDLFPPN